MLPVIWRAVFIERPRRNARSFTLYKHFFKIKPLLRQQEQLKTNAPKDTPVRSKYSVSSSGSHRKQNSCSSAGCYFYTHFYVY
nr:MAG TPA: hypothetical protein [Caudoviricetes sp.]